MKRIFAFGFVLLLTLSLLLASCAPQGASQPEAGTTAPGSGEAAAQEVTAKIGFTASQTGSLNLESTRQLNGLNLWMKQVNDAGGIKLGNGTAVKFDKVFYDDESNKDRVQEHYTKLSTEDNAQFLISPYSSGLADAAARIAEQYGKVMITTGAASDSTYQQGFTLVYQAYTPASKYLTGALDLLAATDPEAKNIAIVHENDKFSTDVSTALNAYAQTKGYNVVLFEGYASDTTDFGPFINKIQDAAPDAIFGGGHFQDGSTFSRQISEKGLDAKFIALLVAPPEPKFAELGDAALGVIGPSQWEPLAAFSADSAQQAGVDFYGPSSEDFTQAYTAEYNEEPSYHAAGGYVAGLLLQYAIEKAGSIDTQAVKTALDNTDILTFFGRLKFDTSAEKHGLQTGHSMVYIQWQKNDAGELMKQVVWPAEGASASITYPAR